MQDLRHKTTEYATAIILRDASRPGYFLAVKRPLDNKDLGGEWGLPAAQGLAGELPGATAERICSEKLVCHGTATQLIGTMFQKRNSYDILLSDIEVLLLPGQAPDVTKSIAKGTTYIEQKWTDDPQLLMPAARKGSCCTSIFLTYCGTFGREDWTDDLTGSLYVA
jgi:hypothetical protein